MRSSPAGFLALFVATAVFAAGAAPTSTPEREDSISAARRDFEAIKAAGDSAQQVKGEVPRLSVPDFQPGAPAPRVPQPAAEDLDPRSKKKKSANWLLDAMEKKPAARPDPRRGTRARGDEIELLLASGRDSEPDPALSEKPDRRDPAIEEERLPAEPPPNPLAPFLEGWMTREDYTLLKPGLEAPAVGTARPGTEGGMPFTLPEGIVDNGRDASRSVPGLERPDFTQASSGANPYLPALAAPLPAPASMAPPPASMSPLAGPPPVIYAPAVAPQPPPSSRIPEFARPAMDDKYFKPLKRF
jgi:hypothetical protein